MRKSSFLSSASRKPFSKVNRSTAWSVHVIGKEPKVVPPLFLGAIHGRIGILDQGLAVRAVFRENADAEAATDG